MENFKYPDDWSSTVAERNDNMIILRAHLTTEEESFSWAQTFGNLNHASWILHHKYLRKETPKRYVSHRRWLCQHSSHGKLFNSKRNTGCPMSIDIKIKLITRNTKDTDKFLKLVPPLQAVIKIEGAHNHPINTAESLRLLRASEETKAQYADFFKNGLSVNNAIRCNEAKLRLSGAAEIDFADASINPTRRIVQNMYDHYRSEAYGNHVDPLEKLAELQDSFQQRGVMVKTTGNSSMWSVVIVTPIMRRAQALLSAGEIIFIDSTSSLETYMSSATVVLTATNAGAIPLAVVIHNSQASSGYQQAFGLLKTSCPSCFCGKQAPDIFMTDDCAAEKQALRAVFPSARQLLCHFHVCQAEWRWLMQNTRTEHRQSLMALFQEIVRAGSNEELSAATGKALNQSSEYPAFSKRLNHFLERKEEWVLHYRLNASSRSHNTNNRVVAVVGKTVENNMVL